MLPRRGLSLDPLDSDDGQFLERRVVPFTKALATALDDRITESVSKMTILAAALRRETLQNERRRSTPATRR